MSADGIYKEGDDLPEGKEVGDVVNRELKEYEKSPSAKRLNKNSSDDANPTSKSNL